MRTRHITMAAAVALAGGLVVPGQSASATHAATVNGNHTSDCGVDWRATSLYTTDASKMPDEFEVQGRTGAYDPSNSGFATEVSPGLADGPGKFEVQHYTTGSGANLRMNWRVFVATDRPILDAGFDVELPAGEYTVSDASTFAVRYGSGVKPAWTTPVTAVSMTPTRVELGDLPANGVAAVVFSTPITEAQLADLNQASASLTGTYVEGFGCEAGTPPEREQPPVLQECQVALTGRTVRGLTSTDVDARIKDSNLPGEVNADSWGGVNGDSWIDEQGRPSWRIYAASDVDLHDVTFTVKAVQGLTFDRGVSFATNGGGALRLVNDEGKQYAGTVTGASDIVVSEDGRTMTVTVETMPAWSSFSLNVAGIPDGSGKAMVVDETLVGTSDLCTAGAPAPKVEQVVTEGAPDCTARTVAVTTVTTTTRSVFDPRTGTWVAGEPERAESTTTRALTDAELRACTPVEPVTPAPVPTTPTTPAPVPTTPTTPAPTTPATPKPTAPTTPAPSTPAPTTPAPTTPAPAPTTPPRDETTRPGSTVKPGAPVKPAPKPRMVTRTFQVDRYMPTSAHQARVVARLDDDGRLRYREDKPLWGASRWQFVTVTVPVNASTAQVVKAINAKTSGKVGDVRTTSKLSSMRAGRSVVVAWELGKGATTKAAWGPKKTVNQTFFARS